MWNLARFVVLAALCGACLYAQQVEAPDQAGNPFAANRGAVASGKILFDQTCAACHGDGAQGGRGPALATGEFTHGSEDADLFRNNRSCYRIAEPIVTFYQAVMRPAWGELEHPGAGAQVWRRMGQTFASKVVGPHFERLCRDWARWYAAPETFGGYQERRSNSTRGATVLT